MARQRAQLDVEGQGEEGLRPLKHEPTRWRRELPQVVKLGFGSSLPYTGVLSFFSTTRSTKCADKTIWERISRLGPCATRVVIGDGAGFYHREGARGAKEPPENLRILILSLVGEGYSLSKLNAISSGNLPV